MKKFWRSKKILFILITGALIGAAVIFLFFQWERDEGDYLTTIPMTMGPHKAGMGVKTFDFSPRLYGPATAYFDYFMIIR